MVIDRKQELESEAIRLFEIHRVVSERLQLCVSALAEHNAYRQALLVDELEATGRTLAETIAERYPAGGRN